MRGPHRQRVQQHAVQQAEDGGVGTNAKCQRQDGHQRESRTGNEYAHGVTKILSNHVMMLTQGGWQEIDERARPDRRDCGDAVMLTRVAQLCDERPLHLSPVLVAEFCGITPEHCAVHRGGTHVQSFRGMSFVARACSSMLLSRRASATATSRPNCVSP